MTFTGRVALVTGAGSGIGRATAQRLAAGGAAVALVDIDEAAVVALADEISRSGARAIAVRADVADASEVDAAVARIADDLGVIDLLVNNAGILRLAPALETPVEVFDRVVAVNLRSVFLLSTEVARRLVAAGRPGSIVNVSSVHAVISEPNASAYTATKGGIEAMARTFASEWADHGIRVNSVRPGAVWTALSTPLYTPQVLQSLGQRVPMHDPGQPDQIAAGICFLASDDASYITGTTLDIDGGFIMDGSLPNAVYR